MTAFTHNEAQDKPRTHEGSDSLREAADDPVTGYGQETITEDRAEALLPIDQRGILMQDHHSRTELRLQVSANGYTPIPNIFKRPGLSGWQNLDPDRDEIISWDRQHVTLTTGLLLKDGLIAFDFDINDPETCTLLDALILAFPVLERALMRTGGGNKEAWFVRCEETFKRIATPVFSDRFVDEQSAMLEVFGGASPRQFGAFGPHSDGVEYLWVQREGSAAFDPSTVRLSDLPVIPKSVVFELVDFTTRWMEDKGFEKLTDAGAGEVLSMHEYTITDRHMFQVNDNAEADLATMRQWASERTSCSMSWLDGAVARNTNRGLVSLDHEGGLCIHDTMTSITHHEERFNPRDPGGSAELRAAMNQLREEQGIEPEPAPRVDMATEERAEILLNQWAYMPSRDMAVEIIGDDPQDGQVPMKGFRTSNAQWARRLGEDDRPANVVGAMVNPVDFWVASPDLVEIRKLAYRPDKSYPLYFDERGQTHKNYYEKPDFSGETGSAVEFVDFIRGLIPDNDEREWMLDAIAFKALNPHVPTPAVLLVDEVGGVGKGLLFDILIQLAGRRNAGLLPQSAVFGGSNMASFQGDWGARVLHCIEELPSVSEATAKEQHQMYNRLKELVDPRPRMELMPVKYGKPIEVYTCATYWMATNHVDAIPIPANDRRIVVLTCGGQRTREYYRSVFDLAQKPENIRALYQMLEARDLSKFDSTYAPDTIAKTAMIEATRYGSEVLVRSWIADVVDKIGELPDYLTTQTVLNAVRSEDPGAFIGQTGTRRVNAALRRIGYRAPLCDGVRNGGRYQIRVKHLSVGDGDRESLLQLERTPHDVGINTNPPCVAEYVKAVANVSEGTENRSAKELRELLKPTVVDITG